MTPAELETALGELRPLAMEWLQQCRTAAIPMGDVHHGRTPIFDTRYDDKFLQLAGFEPVLSKFQSVPEIEERYGPGFHWRLLLGLAFDVVPRVVAQEQPDRVEAIIDEAWRAFVAELLEPNWHYVAAANLGGIVPLAGFDENAEVALGVRVMTRSAAFIKSLGGAADLFQKDWSEGSHSELVIVAEAALTKSASNVMLSIDPAIVARLDRSLTAMRLSRPGGLRRGVIFCLRKTRFIRIGGVSTLGPGSSSTYAPETTWDNEARGTAAAIYSKLVALEPSFANRWAALAIAIRKYESALNRSVHESIDRVIDATTAIEALVGEPLEATFKVRFRTATLLGESNDDVRALFTLAGRYYSLRSKLVHGATLEQKHGEMLLRCDRWVEIARLLIRAVISLAEKGVFTSRSELGEKIDASLIHAADRELIREEFNERWSEHASQTAQTEPVSRIIGFAADVPSEASIKFFGKPI